MIPEIRQILKTQEDDAVKAKFSPEELKKALIDPSRSDREKINLVEMAKKQIKEELDEKAGKVAKGELVKQGEGFTMKDDGKPYQYAQQTFKPEQWINDLSGILTDEWAANLKSLAVKHPEMFKSEADVFRVIKEIKNNPTRFFKNNNSENALILKDLSETKTGEVGIRKTDGQIIHATTNDKEKRLNQLNKRQNKILVNTQLESSDRSARPNRHSDASRTMATADKAGSVANKPIIPQSSQKVKELSPAELRRAIINAKDDKERLAIIENQKAGIRKNLDTKAIIDASPQSGRDMAIIGRKNLNADIIQYAQENKKIVAVDSVAPDLAKNLGFKYPNETKRTIYADEITHTLKNHGNEAAEAKRGQIAITRDDIASYIDYVENPDKQILSQTKQGLKALISGKQKDGYYVVVEEAQTKNNRLAFKTMYKVRGDIKESSLFKATADTENGERLAFSGYKPDAQRVPSLDSSIIPQNLKNASIDEWQREISKAGGDWSGLKRLMDQIKHSETLGQNERVNLYVDISDRMKELREARK